MKDKAPNHSTVRPLMRSFPQELVDQVIDDLAATSHTNLNDIGTCAAVCRRWLPRSRKHLFRHIRLSHAALLEFLDLVEASSAPLLSFVRSLDIRIIYDEPFTEDQVAPLQRFLTLTELCIRAPNSPVIPAEQLRFQSWLQTHVPRFGAACATLTRFELVFNSDIPLSVVTDIISSLPHLTHLRLYGGDYHRGNGGIVHMQSMLVPPTAVLPPHLHMLDISLRRGSSLLFAWLLSHHDPPVLTSLTLRGFANGAPTAPIDTYLQHFGPKIESLSLDYWVDIDPLTESNAEQTRSLEARALACTPGLVNLTLAWQDPESIPGTLMLLSSRPLITISIGVGHNAGRSDWPLIDQIFVAPRFAALHRLVFTGRPSRKSLLTAEVRALMPQACARGILH